MLKPHEQVVKRDADVCLGVLLDRNVAMYVSGEGQKTTKLHMTIREVVEAIVRGPDEARKPLTMQLDEFGVRPIWSRADREWRVAVCASEHHSGMRRLM